MPMIDEEKLVQLYRKTNRELFVYIYRFIGSRESAEDILHDCFLKLMEYSEKHELHEEGVRAFLYKTAHNMSINHLKRKKRIEFTPIDDINSPVTLDNIDDKIETEEMEKHVSDYLATLDEVTRSIFIMKKEMEMSIPEIAEKVGKSERTVRRRLHSVLEGLSGHLKKAGYLSFLLFFLSVFCGMIVQLYRGNSLL